MADKSESIERVKGYKDSLLNRETTINQLREKEGLGPIPDGDKFFIKEGEQSGEGKYVIWKCIECGHNHYIHQDSYTQDGLRCEECGGIVNIAGFTDTPPKSPVMKKNGLSVKIDIDVSDALKGLKAVQREAKKTARFLRVVEDRIYIKDLTDDEIFKVLASRGWDMNEVSFHAGGEEPKTRRIEMNKNNE